MESSESDAVRSGNPISSEENNPDLYPEIISFESGDSDSPEYWAKMAKLAFDVSCRNPQLKNSLYAPAKNLPKELRHRRMMNALEYGIYAKKCRESKGFDVSGCTGNICGGIKEIFSKKMNNIARDLAQFAVEDYNLNHESHFEYMGMLKANYQQVAGGLFYITLKVLDKNVNQVKYYRAKVFDGFRSGNKAVRIFEEAPEGTQELATPSTQKKLKKKPKAKSRKQANQAYLAFVKMLRALPMLADTEYKEVLQIASHLWPEVLPEAKEEYKKSGNFPLEPLKDNLVEEVLRILRWR